MTKDSWRTTLRSFLDEPQVENPPAADWRDYALVTIGLISLVLELVLRDDVTLPFVAGPLAAIIVIAIRWRREYPLPVFVLTFGSVLLFDLVALIAGKPPINIYTTVVALIFVFALFRWGSGREAAIGSALAFVVAINSNIVDDSDWTGDLIGGLLVLCFPAVLGAAIRFRGTAREQALEQVKIQERTVLARELHDTVAHHVSAIAIQAQAGQFLAKSNSLQGAADALAVIEEEASRTLIEMRSIVGVLRDTESPAELAPQHGLSDLESLIPSAAPGVPAVEIRRSGDLEDVGPAVGTTIYRLTQESITNAIRHADSATRIDVSIEGLADSVSLTITDDGLMAGAGARGGFGLIGMNERATLLGGSLDAGPQSVGGWQVRATLPRRTT